MANADTRNKRASAIGFALAFRLIGPNPDGSLAPAGDREQVAYSYSGIAASPVVVTVKKIPARAPYFPPQIGAEFSAQIARVELAKISRAIPPMVTRTVTAAWTVAATDDTVLVDTTAGNVTGTLLPANQVQWLRVQIKNIGTHAATVNGTVDGYTGIVLTGAGDSITIQSDGISWRLLTAPYEAGDVRLYGVTLDGTTDDTIAQQAAWTAIVASGGEIVYPAGTVKFSTLAITAATGVTLRTAGRYATRLLTTTTVGDAITVTTANMLKFAGVELSCATQRTAGAMLKLSGVQNSYFDELRIQSPWIGIDASGSCNEVYYDRVLMLSQNNSWNWSDGFRFQTCTGQYLTRCVVNYGTANISGGGLNVDSGCDTVEWANCSFGQNGGTAGGATGGRGIWIHHSLSPSSFAPRWQKAVSTAAEGGSGASWAIDAVNNLELIGCYGATGKQALNITGGSDIKVVGGEYVNAARHGVDISGGSNITLLAPTVTAASQETNNTYDAINVSGGSNVEVIRPKCGDTTSIVGATNTMLNAVNIGAGVTDAYVDLGPVGSLCTNRITRGSVQSDYRTHRETESAAAPVSGTWRVGDRAWNTVPTVGQPKSWVCTVAGTPGTWVSEGNL